MIVHDKGKRPRKNEHSTVNFLPKMKLFHASLRLNKRELPQCMVWTPMFINAPGRLFTCNGSLVNLISVNEKNMVREDKYFYEFSRDLNEEASLIQNYVGQS